MNIFRSIFGGKSASVKIDSQLRASLIVAFAEACANEEGFYVTEAQAKERKIAWPTLAQKNNNPVNLRMWGSHPIRFGYAHFLPDMPPSVMPGQLPKTHAGWKAAYKQVERCVFERHLTFYTIFAGQRDEAGKVITGGYSGWAPSEDNNKPTDYAQFVLAWLKVNWEPLKAQSQDHKNKLSIATVVETLACVTK